MALLPSQRIDESVRQRHRRRRGRQLGGSLHPNTHSNATEANVSRPHIYCYRSTAFMDKIHNYSRSLVRLCCNQRIFTTKESPSVRASSFRIGLVLQRAHYVSKYSSESRLALIVIAAPPLNAERRLSLCLRCLCANKGQGEESLNVPKHVFNFRRAHQRRQTNEPQWEQRKQ